MSIKMEPENLAKPLHLQNLERSLDIKPFLSYVDHIFTTSISDDSSSGSEPENGLQDIESLGKRNVNGIFTNAEDRRSDRMRLYNFDSIGKSRQWLKNVLISDSSDSSDSGGNISDSDLQDMLRLHLMRKKYQEQYYLNPENSQYMYYGAGILSNYDKFPDHQKMTVVNKKRKKERKLEKKMSRIKRRREKYSLVSQDQDLIDGVDFDESYLKIKEEDDPDCIDDSVSMSKTLRGRKKSQQSKSPEVMAMRRRKIWILMSKKELGKVQRAKINNHKEMLTSCRRVAQYCVKHWRQKAMQSQKNMKETIWRAKRLTREMQSYWKRYDRVERETRRRQEKEAEEQRKLDGELMEAKRQQRKLNFLITQTELYAHFMSRKLGVANPQDQMRILNHLEEEKLSRGIDDYDSEAMKQKAKKNVRDAFNAEQARSKQFRNGVASELTEDFKLTETSISADEERPQPSIFRGKLKHYQLKGMNWLANLYDQGINGILADEMGLGKTVQSIAFLCHTAEKYDVWGPFLIISPASTLHNWQQEMARFVPDFRVIPYWGSPQERKILRMYWDQKGLHTREASFHVVITSYQLVITDFKYFNRIKWQYLVLDEAQALKSTNSVRWKLLLGFSCRNRLLLTGTPIQNSMAELWALLHFIMPTLFDSHDEFNEWFSKDIESHAENKTGIDEKHLSRLHMILKPFMLRRIKKDVENELSDKIEVMVYCPLTTRQKLLYSALKKKIRIEDLLYSSSGGGANQSSQSVTSSLMNLVMQFRKVCNHPELFERREAKSPFFFPCSDYILPRLLFDDGLLHKAFPSKAHLLHNQLNIFNTEYVHRTLFGKGESISNSCFSFSRLIQMSPQEVFRVALEGLLHFWLIALSIHFTSEKRLWLKNRVYLIIRNKLSYLRSTDSVFKNLVFTKTAGSSLYTHTTHYHWPVQETLDHRILRSRKVMSATPDEQLSKSPTGMVKSPKSCKSPEGKSPSKASEESSAGKFTLLPEIPHISRPPRVLEYEPTYMPTFLYHRSQKVHSSSRVQFCSSRAAAWSQVYHEQCGNKEALTVVMSGPSELLLDPVRGFHPEPLGGLAAVRPSFGWSGVIVPDKQTLVTDAGKLYVLDGLLKRLKEQGHRVLIYSQMTRMIDLLEEYMWYRKHTFMRLDGSSKISERRDMVADFQSRADIFVFLLSTRAGGLGINLTAADTVIFYDSDWNPTVDQQAMDRAHRLGQTKQVTVYRLICKGSIEERILSRARDKSEIQRMVISGGNFKPDTLKPTEVVSLLLDDDEIEKKYRQKQAERKTQEDYRVDPLKEKERDKRKKQFFGGMKVAAKKPKIEDGAEDSVLSIDSTPTSPAPSEMSQESGALPADETSNDGLVVDVESSPATPKLYPSPFASNMLVTGRPRPTGRGTKRGRPRGSRRGIVCRGRPLSLNITAADLGIDVSPVLTTEVTTIPGQTGIKRGPGRPRLKPAGPGHQGVRGPPRPRKAPGPLPVPIRSGTSLSGANEQQQQQQQQQRHFGFYTQKEDEAAE